MVDALEGRQLLNGADDWTGGPGSNGGDWRTPQQRADDALWEAMIAHDAEDTVDRIAYLQWAYGSGSIGGDWNANPDGIIIETTPPDADYIALDEGPAS